MVAHGSLHVLHTEFMLGHYPEGHVFSVGIKSLGPRQIAGEAIGKAIEECPHAGITETASSEVGARIGHLPVDLVITPLEPPFASGKGNDVLAIEHILLVFHVEAPDAALVGMCADSVIGDALGHPHHFLASRTTAHHLHNPCFIRVADGESFALAVVAISLYQGCHHANGFAGCA